MALGSSGHKYIIFRLRCIKIFLHQSNSTIPFVNIWVWTLTCFVLVIGVFLSHLCAINASCLKFLIVYVFPEWRQWENQTCSLVWWTLFHWLDFYCRQSLTGLHLYWFCAWESYKSHVQLKVMLFNQLCLVSATILSWG